MSNIWRNSIEEATDLLITFSDDVFISDLELLSRLTIETIKSGGTIFIAGNGGSHADAMHFAEELTGRYRNDREPIAAIALGSNPAHLTCVSNDYGFDQVFVREFQALAKKGDLLIMLSTSGNSQNLINTFAIAKEKGISNVALLGRDGGVLKLAGLPIIVPGKTSDRIQELHMLILHILVETIEASI